MNVTRIESSDSPGLEPIPAEAYERDRPDARVIVTERGRPSARCSCWWRSVPNLPAHRLGLIGHYAALNEETGRKLLALACARLSAEGSTMAVGPIDGSTWRPYRFVTTRGAEPAFFLEPDNPDQWPADFVAAGFAPFAMYHSAVTDDLAGASAGRLEAEERVNAIGITIRELDLARLDEELHRLYAVSHESFRENFLYTPIAEDEFRHHYRAIAPFLQPELVTIAELEGQPIGFLFAIPDALEARRTADSSIRTVVIKSLAVAPQWRRVGLGRVLLGRTHGVARQLGYQRAVHALMHDANISGGMSRKSARPMRRYTLFARTL